MLFDISDFVNRDQNFNYYLIRKEEHVILNQITKFVGNDERIMLPFVSRILEVCYPFVQNKFVTRELIDKSIKQGECVHQMISNSINLRKSQKLVLEIGECKNSNHINLAKRMITELNSFIYKYNIQKIYSEKTFAYINYDCNFIGTIDIICETEGKVFLIDIKTSRKNYSEKYNAQLFLYKKMFTHSSKKPVINCFILNPREDRVIEEYCEPTKQERALIIKTINSLMKIEN